MKLFTALSFGIFFSIAQTGHTAAISKTANSKVTMPAEKTSLIEKALTQQKMDDKKRSDESLKAVTSFKTAPAQSFFASQNQSFSRFVQALFATNAS
ncbi:hypothetical protein [Acinetobacter tianfuensis]|uniref:DUF4179 domain-containing protein n=1 Tax=Acinetobacter tianfuensis TaxID=2419603 RepID=A0A3A8EIZ9_9GAMM|nr:hypothetical protein [Acinetobacter tianfuensis]RKG33456.1 hypothetical protein D7V32_03020 [Acinetobacter tianfuensis]